MVLTKRLVNFYFSFCFCVRANSQNLTFIIYVFERVFYACSVHQSLPYF